MLDLCCCSGGFSIHAGLYGAKSVDAVDVSESALELVRENAALNGLENVNTICQNVFDLAKEYCEAGKTYDVVILDPPAFAKSRRVLEPAYKGYKELNYRCMKLTNSGGFMVTCSCSQFMTKELFLKMLREAAKDSGREVRLIREVMPVPGSSGGHRRGVGAVSERLGLKYLVIVCPGANNTIILLRYKFVLDKSGRVWYYLRADISALCRV